MSHCFIIETRNTARLLYTRAIIVAKVRQKFLDYIREMIPN